MYRDRIHPMWKFESWCWVVFHAEKINTGPFRYHPSRIWEIKENILSMVQSVGIQSSIDYHRNKKNIWK